MDVLWTNIQLDIHLSDSFNLKKIHLLFEKKKQPNEEGNHFLWKKIQTYK